MATTETTSTTTTSSSNSNLVHKRWRTLFFVSTALFIVALVFFLLFWDKSRKATAELKNEKVRTEHLEADRQKLTERVNRLTNDQAELNESLTIAQENLSAKEIVITRLNQENRTLNTIKGQIVELEKETKSIDASNGKIQAIHSKMRNTIAAREKQNKAFEGQLK